MPDPIPAEAPYGIANWTDYVHNWREIDAEWIQARAILRFASAAARNAAVPSASAGQFVYNYENDILEYWSKSGSWKTYKPLPQYTSAYADSATEVKIGHSSSGGAGVRFSPTEVSVDQTFSIMNGVLTADGTGVSIKTGSAIAKLTTDATHLIADKPVRTSAIDLTGSGTVFSAVGKTVAVGTLTGTQVTTTNASVSGTLTGGVLNGSSGTIGGVKLGLIANYAEASGFIASGGFFYGGSTNAIMRFRNPAGGTLGDSFIQILDAGIYLDGGTTYIRNTWRVENATAPFRNVVWTLPSTDGYLGPLIYSASDPGAANCPNGTIWISP